MSGACHNVAGKEWQSIWALVFAHLFPGWLDSPLHPKCEQEQRENRRALARATRTCRTFSEPALDVLWRALDHVNPLLMLLPSYMKDETSGVWVRTLV